MTGRFLIGLIAAAWCLPSVNSQSGESLVAAEDVVPALSNAVLSDAITIIEGSTDITSDTIANLAAAGIPDATIFGFNADGIEEISIEARTARICKSFPGESGWPYQPIWWIFNLLTGNRLIETVPLAASCYKDWMSIAPLLKAISSDEALALCASVTDNFTVSDIHAADPTSVMWPLYQGRTCMPTNDTTKSCTLGGFPSYVVNVTSIGQIQLAVNFARNTNLRLVVKNTGHDFNGKSAGAGALSIWTHHLKDITYIERYRCSSYTGKAIKMGSGVQAFEVYAAAKANSVTVVGGEGRTVGVSGGFILGGGHSPLSSLYGMAADQVLAMEVVTPDGKFRTASVDLNPDLFWALRGGGGGTYGVVTSVTVKVYPVIPVTTMQFSFATGANVSADAFWQGARAYFDYFIDNTDAGTYAYFSIAQTGPGAFSFGMQPFFAPNMTATELNALMEPWFTRLARLGIAITPVVNEYNNFYDAWWAVFPLEVVGITNIKTASRLFPKSNWENEISLNTTFDAIKSTIELGGSFLAFNIAAAGNDGSNNAVNPAWRETCLHGILAVAWAPTASDAEIVTASNTLTNVWMQKWRDVSPNAGAYMSEADILEPNFQQAFYGSNYDRLYALKQKYDPSGLLYTPTGVGSEDWQITGQLEGLPTQNGRLCPV